MVAWDAVASSFVVQLSQKSSTSCCSTFSFELHFVLSSLPASSLDVLARRSFGDKVLHDVLQRIDRRLDGRSSVWPRRFELEVYRRVAGETCSCRSRPSLDADIF